MRRVKCTYSILNIIHEVHSKLPAKKDFDSIHISLLHITKGISYTAHTLYLRHQSSVPSCGTGQPKLDLTCNETMYLPGSESQ